MKKFSLHLVTDNRLDNLPEFISSVIDCGITHVQFRHKPAQVLGARPSGRASEGDKKEIPRKLGPVGRAQLYAIGKKILKITRAKKIPLIINDHVDLALALNADGVHIGQTDMPYELVRKKLGANKIIGLTIETVEQIQRCEKWDVNYFGVGSVFATSSKPDANVIGITQLKNIIACTQKPCIAIGGIQIHDVKNIIVAGAAGIAVVSGICSAENPTLAATQYAQVLNA